MFCRSLLFLLFFVSAQAQVAEGTSKADVISQIGWPQSVSTSGKREILNYEYFTILLEEGRVVNLTPKPPSALKRATKTVPTRAPVRGSTVVPAPTPRVQPVAEPATSRQYSPPARPIGTGGVDNTPASGISNSPSQRTQPVPSTPFFLRILPLLVVGGIIASLVALLRLKNKQDSTNRFLRSGSTASEQTVPVHGDGNTPVSSHRPDPLRDGWSLSLLKEIEWHRFEQLVAAFEAEKGFHSELTAFGADGGIDVRVFDKENGQPLSIIQCKAFDRDFIGVQMIREFFGVMVHEKIPEGSFYTTSDFTVDARAFAAGKPVILVTGDGFLQEINRLPLSSQLKLFELATAGDYRTPTCARCGVKMILRTGKNGQGLGKGFWGCVNYPRCSNKIHLSRAS